jgi:hypothetical protein
MPKRPKLPGKLRQQLLYESQFACVVCQAKADHIHHIDKNNANNDLENLVVLCQTHHDEAHTIRELSQNLSGDRILGFKSLWLANVKEHREKIASAAAQREAAHPFLSVGVTWGYINHGRVAQLINREILGMVDGAILNRCLRRHLVDERGILIKPDNWKPCDLYLKNTIYDWFNHGDALAVHILYSELVDILARRLQPIHMTDETWTRTFIRSCLEDGSFLFFRRAHYFVVENQDNENAHIRVYTFKKRIRVEYFVDSRNMFGNTSITVSFRGHRSCAAFIQVKSIERTDKDLVLLCTPIALGVGFQSDSGNSGDTYRIRGP